MAKTKSLQGRGKAKNSLANLKKWEPGQSGNPLGARAHNPAVKAFKSAGRETYQKILEIVLYGDEGDLEKLIADPKASVLEKITAKAFQDALNKNNFSLVERIAEQIFGKQAETVNIGRSGPFSAEVQERDVEETAAALKRIKDKYE